MKKKKMFFHENNLPCHDGNNTQIILQIASTLIIFYRYVLSDFNPQKMLSGKRFATNKNMTAKTEDYFAVKHK